jgi:hypothetical protein
MGNQSKGSIHLALGVAASKVKQISTHRYCRHCLEEQYHQYGEFFGQDFGTFKVQIAVANIKLNCQNFYNQPI